jgi:predicted nucleic acid-binding protein
VIVVDASILLDLLLRRPATLAGVEAVFAGREHEPLHAPELIEPEALNALRRLVRTEMVEPHHAREAVADLHLVRLVRHPHAPLRARVWHLRNALSAYDATYLALAAGDDDALLMTADSGLATVAERMLGRARVRHLA